MEIYKNEELRKQIVNDGSEWVGQQQFWLFGTAKYFDGTIISREEAEKDVSRFFNKLDRALLKRIDLIENRRLERLVFIETGRTRTNTHIHFYIKGNDYVGYEQIVEQCEKIWIEDIKKSYEMDMRDNKYAGNRRDGYCYKEMRNLNEDVLHVDCCHINLT